MKYVALLLVALSLEAHAATQGADRTITWRPWQEWAEFRVRTGDRYLGHQRWEHFLAVPTQHQENQDLDDLSGYAKRAGCCDSPGKTLRNSQSYQLDHDCTQRPLELDCTGDAVDKSPLIYGAYRVSAPFFH
jgi:hypothetical protein